MTDYSSMTFEALRAQPSGPHKKFYLIKNCRAAIVAATDRSPRELSCEELVNLIEKALISDHTLNSNRPMVAAPTAA
jgi:hypothetical protein